MSETALVSACLTYLRAQGWPAFRMNSGALRNPQGRPVFFGTPGLPDVQAVLPAGRALFVECKRKGNKPTETQERVMAELRRAGALVAVVYAIDDLERALASQGYVKWHP